MHRAPISIAPLCQMTLLYSLITMSTARGLFVEFDVSKKQIRIALDDFCMVDPSTCSKSLMVITQLALWNWYNVRRRISHAP